MGVHEVENKRWSTKPQGLEFRHSAALSLITGHTVLDVGCGDGLLLKALTAKGHVVEGVDLSSVAVQRCRDEGLQVTEGDFTAQPLPFADKQFETVVALDVLEHVYEPEKLLAEMVRVSSHEVIIGVPNFSSLPARLQVLFGSVPENNRPHKAHVYWFNWPVLQDLVMKQGLAIATMCTNVPRENMPLVGALMRGFARICPNAGALSFVIVCKKL